MEKAAKNQKQSAPGAASAKTPPPAPPPARVPPLFRNIDWIALAFAFAVVWIVYFLTLAPEQTLEDSGELCTGSFYAGIPHPPGYPFWAIYSWLWTKLLPIGNVAWRVEVGEATAAAMACGLIALIVSRGSSMLMEGIEDLKSLGGKWENAICMVSGIVAGLLLGLGGVMWSESVAINRISLFGVPWVTLVLVFLLRWIYAPHQRRYLYSAMFFFGICATIHQTLLIAAMGIEVAIIAAQPRLGRDVLCMGNSIGYLVLWYAHAHGLVPQLLESLNNPIVSTYFHIIGVGSIVGCVVLAIRTKGLLSEWLPCIIMGLLYAAGASFYFYEPIAGMTDPPMQWGYPRTVEGFFHALSRGQYEKANPSDAFGNPGHFLVQLGMLIGDIAQEFNWVCIFIALVPLLFFFKMQKRERAWISGLTAIYACIGLFLLVLMNPSPERSSADLIKVFFTSSHAVIAVMFGYGLALTAAYMATHYQSFRVVGLMLGLVTLVPALITLYNGVNTTFFGGSGWVSPTNLLFLFLCLTASFVLATLAAQSFLRKAAIPADQPQSERLYFLTYAIIALMFLGLSTRLAFFNEHSLSLKQVLLALPRVFAPNQYSLPVVAGLLILGISLIFIAALLIYRHRAPLAITLGLFAMMPLASGLSHWAASEQRNHWFGYWFGHDMFTPPFNGSDGKPLYPEMARDTILFGGTDPGRFCPTYMIFCESFIPHDCQPLLDQNFDRRDVYLITQNALADGTYLCYLRAQYFRSQQIDPPFFSELGRTLFKDKDYETNLLARLVSPLDTYFMARGARVEKRWRTYTSWFAGKDFTHLPALAARLRPGGNQDPLSLWLFQHLGKETQDLITRSGDENRLRRALADDLNLLLDRELVVKKQLAAKQQEKESVDQQISEGDRSERLRSRQEQLGREIAQLNVEPLYDPNRFATVKLSEYLRRFIAQNPQSDTRIRLNRLLLEAAYPDDIAKSLGGVYPDREIYIPSNEDSQFCFSDYIKDASVRLAHDQQFPNEPRQIKPGEGVSIDNASGKVQVSGQVAVMSINGLLTKVIFDHNPGNEFYVEESYPLDWMYPHLTPFGIIMKINRQPLPEITDEIVRRDHEFWSQYSERLVGNWITYDTSVKEIVDWIEKVYLRRDFTGFTGDRRFVRDDEGQKAFSKLRSSIGGIYLWRLGWSPTSPTPPQYLPKSEAERQRMIKEADFAFRQAFTFCPYSPEAVFRYVVNFLLPMRRFDDALLVARTCLKLDPENGQVINLVNQLEEFKKQPAMALPASNQIGQLENELRAHPDDFQKAFELASLFSQLGQTDRVIQVLDRVLDNPHVRVEVVLAVAQAYAQMNNPQKLESALEKLTQLAPNEPETWYNLASVKAGLGKSSEALQALRQSLDLSSKRLARDPKANDLRPTVEKDPHFAALHATPEYKALFPPK